MGHLLNLQQRFRSGEPLKFHFFWGHTPSHGRVNESCLSQWHVAPFVIENHCYPTAEHFMMAEKARLFNDGDAR
ncbi:MAG TPA: NADAR family protein, partial [Oligoflexus sp.]|uniref:NADAR family protein n=1 Tax=Oligoflexus sp. TaxID=1971216 RepID=UPI002D63136B